MKKGDKIVAIIITILLFFLLMGYYFYNKTLQKDNLVAIIKQDGKVIDKIDLNRSGNKEFKIKNGKNYNIVKIENGRVSVIESNCPSHECIKTGTIKNPGQVIACIPNKLIISIEGRKNEGDVDITSF